MMQRVIIRSLKASNNSKIWKSSQSLSKIKYFSTDENKKPNISSDETTTQKSSSIPSSSSHNKPPTRSLLSDFASLIITNVQEAWGEMTGSSKASSLKRKVAQAHAYKPQKQSDNDDENEAEYQGPTSIVLVKEPQSAWESMKNRLSDSPIIQSILKGTAKVTKVVSQTEIGQQATKVTENVRNTIEDVREIWETSQNPIIYTLANTWDSITSETEEGIIMTHIIHHIYYTFYTLTYTCACIYVYVHVYLYILNI